MLHGVFPVLQGKERATVTRKLLQSGSKFGMAFMKGGKYFAIIGNTSNWLQYLERNTGEVLKQTAAESSSVSSEVAKLFTMRARLACCDRRGANDRTERSILKDRQDDCMWIRLRIFCE
eukprot:2987244-Pyramimonas_sp.AAC.1